MHSYCYYIFSLLYYSCAFDIARLNALRHIRLTIHYACDLASLQALVSGI